MEIEAEVGVEVWLRVGVDVVVMLVTLSVKRTRGRLSPRSGD